MASNKFSINNNDDYTAVTVASTSDPSKDVEVLISSTLSVERAFICLEKIKNYLLRRGTT